MEDHSQALSTRARGHALETLALDHLCQAGLHLLQRNYHCRLGEIDLIMRDGQALVFVEVRYRQDSRHGSGIDSVNPRKQARLIRCASCFLHQHKLSHKVRCRFDVVGLSGPSERPRIKWIKNAFTT